MNRRIAILLAALLAGSGITTGTYAARVFEFELARDETPIIDNHKLPPGWAVASDPELARFGDRWWLFFNSIRLDFEAGLPIHVLAASLPPGESLAAAADQWTVHPEPVVSPGPAGAWDERTIETVKFVHGYDASARRWVGRLYFVGWPRQRGGKKHYQIGFAQWDETTRRWIKHGEPIVSGTEPWERMNDSSFIGDQSVYYAPGPGANGADGTWHLWYQAVSKPRDGGISIVHVSSRDGVRWGDKRRLSHSVPFTDRFVKTGPFSLDVMVRNGRYYFAGFLYNSRDLSKQGLWLTHSSTPDGSAPGDFEDWYPLLFENNGVYWHDSGPESSRCHATGLFAPTLREDQGRLWMFYHGYYRTGEVDDPCVDRSKNSGLIGRALIADHERLFE
jgi:hypothetical protein